MSKADALHVVCCKSWLPRWKNQSKFMEYRSRELAAWLTVSNQQHNRLVTQLDMMFLLVAQMQKLLL